MIGIHRFEGRWGRSRWSVPLLGLLAAGVVGCGSLLEQDNPNNVPAENVEDPFAAAALVAGAQRQMAFGVTSMLLVYETVTDALDWSGSRDGWRELDNGRLSNAFNEFTDAAYPTLAQSRWLTDEAIKILTEQQAAGTLRNQQDLARAHLWSAMAYVTIADMFDDWAFSDRRESAAPIGPNNMGTLYDSAITRLNTALPLASGNAALTLQIRMMRARASFSRAIWDLAGKQPISSSHIVQPSTYVTNAEADADWARQNAAAQYTFRFTFNSAIGRPDPGAWINQRQEMRVGKAYATQVGSLTWGSTTLRDPIDVTKSPVVVDSIQANWKTGYPYHTMLSAREMHLILAEARLANADTAGFTTAINRLRALDGLTSYSGQITPEAMLEYSRKANLFLQGRRLADHYRFRQPSGDWPATSQAVTSPGTFLPITAIECLSNTFIGAANCSR